MKIKTKEQYDARYERRGAKLKASDLQRARDYMQTITRRGLPYYLSKDPTWRRPVDHKARTHNLEDVFGSIYRPKKSHEHLKGIVQVGELKECHHVLVKWLTDHDENGKEVYIPRAYPCMVHHGWEKSKGVSLRRAMGKKGEHEDSLGRKW